MRQEKKLEGLKVLITAGPTYESIDPVRFIGNRSSGKMGIALANCAYASGADVHLVCGPTHLQPEDGVHLTRVDSAQEMFDSCKALFESMDVVIFAAAVADYRPENVAVHKLKKSGNELNIKLVKNIDIAYELGKLKTTQKNIGFALETEKGEMYAHQKREKKNFDAIVLNTLNDQNQAFGANQNKITIIDNTQVLRYDSKPKTAVAIDIISYISALI